MDQIDRIPASSATQFDRNLIHRSDRANDRERRNQQEQSGTSGDSVELHESEVGLTESDEAAEWVDATEELETPSSDPGEPGLDFCV
jgi:hypothetical protein